MKSIGKNIVTSLAMLSLIAAFPACRQSTDDLILASSSSGVIPAVYQSITQKYPGATNVRGQTLDGTRWLVTFTDGATTRMSLLAYNGDFLDGEQQVPTTVLPQVVYNALIADTPGASVQKVSTVQQSGVITGWRINCLDPSAKAYTFLIGPTGTIIDKR